MNKLFLLFLAPLLLFACKDKGKTPKPDFVKGKNYFTVMVDGDEREYYVHVPESYNGKDPVPLVFMLHGTSGDGERYYNISGWKAIGEQENIITVYPSSWRYCYISDGKKKNNTRWNTLDMEYCANENPRDDIKFLRTILAEVEDRYQIDEKRVYLVGFSNGGGMAFRCAVEMADVFAAIVQSAGTYLGDDDFMPARFVPITYQIGNSDNKFFGAGARLPLASFDSLLRNEPSFKKIRLNHARILKYSTEFQISGDTAIAMTANFPSIPEEDDREFRIILIKGLEHQYPNGSNHPYKAAEENWEWMKQYTLP